ncbi:hypothetical protein BIV60_11465 [Bacillus sp. MUM 116]|uniref:hypothetical protein n=1 Tax=Bacillus sp. MUM 116 TaxID=1678002 RepID=UPI0008F56D41|nr:hypothetical protein [Bacillus sp. MUM 116]OIK14578.1 hypothetical protein BIV60_11465 [Bacillus sp. MUM 116]
MLSIFTNFKRFMFTSFGLLQLSNIVLKRIRFYFEKGFAQKFLLGIENIFNNGPKKLSNEEKEFLKAWLRKMYLRSNKNEGNYRFHWMLKDSLEIYSSLNGIWYLGPKKAFSWLRENDEVAYNLFNNALTKETKKNNIEELLEYLNGM